MDEARTSPILEDLRRSAGAFVGRDGELSRIQTLLADPACALLTLVGPGGIGKTRLALEVAAAAEAIYDDGVFFVSLEAANTPSVLLPTIASALNLQFAEEQEAADQLIAFLRDRSLLLVLDAVEQVWDAVGELNKLLRAAPRLQILVTSREALNLTDEWLFAVGGLPYPHGPEADERELEKYGAVALFANRARQVRPDFSLEDEAEAVVRICRQTEGLPLALELAASWVRTLACREIGEEIQENLDFLTARLQDVPPQHQSMRAVFHQSWERLRPEQQKTFSRLSVFRGGFRRLAAEEVGQAGLADLSALVDRSLVRRDSDGRYHIHNLLRQYGAEKLARSEEELEATQAAHSRHYVRFLEERTEALRGGRQVQAMAEIEGERQNIRLAWEWSVGQRQLEQIAAAAEPLNLFYDFRGYYLEGIRVFEAARDALDLLEPSAEAQRVLALVCVYLGGLYLRVGRLEEAEHNLGRSQRIFGRLEMAPPPGYTTDPRLLLGFLSTVRGRFDLASQLGRDGLETAQKDNHLLNQQIAHYLLARAALLQGKLAEARSHAQQSYALARTNRDRWFMAYCLNELGYMASRMGDYGVARQHYSTSYKIRREFQDPEGMALALGYLGDIARHEGRHDEAARLYKESLAISEEIGNRGNVALALQGLARTAIGRGNPAEARRLLRQALRPVQEGKFVSLFLSLLVDMANLFNQSGTSQQIAPLLALAIAHSGTEPEARERAQALWEEAVGAEKDDVQPALPADAEWPALEQLLFTLQSELELLAAEPAGNSQPEINVEVDPDAVGGTGAGVLAEPLTKREAEVLVLIGEGLSNAEIADQLVLALGTVKYYTSEIYGKLGVHNRVAAVRRAQELGLLDR